MNSLRDRTLPPPRFAVSMVRTFIVLLKALDKLALNLPPDKLFVPVVRDMMHYICNTYLVKLHE